MVRFEGTIDGKAYTVEFEGGEVIFAEGDGAEAAVFTIVYYLGEPVALGVTGPSVTVALDNPSSLYEILANKTELATVVASAPDTAPTIPDPPPGCIA